ncbi:MAG: exonuclease SbcCD subunit D [Erysipelothrix sp.]
MKIIHLSDLHIGKRFEDVSLIDDQRYIFNQILEEIKSRDVDVVIVAGDIYDRFAPSSESFTLWNELLIAFSKENYDVVIISGNHDSVERLGVGDKLFIDHKIHLISRFELPIVPIIIFDEWGPVNFYPIPFLRASTIKNLDTDFTGSTYDDAFKHVIKAISFNPLERNVAIVHQFFIDGMIQPELSDSEIGPQVGGLDAININYLNDFDYVAMGHIHRPQKLRKETIRYGGSPLKYSFSEAKDHKSMPYITFVEKDANIELLPLIPKRDVRIIKGPFTALIEHAQYSEDFIQAILEDEETIYDPKSKLKEFYPNIISIQYHNLSSSENIRLQEANEVLSLPPTNQFENFFKYQNQREFSDSEKMLLESIMEEINHETN